ncbi:CBS domain-containing protein [Streptomyces sp. Act143]|nr:CBS domain-containing protein [Streptomyces sp. Act143]
MWLYGALAAAAAPLLRWINPSDHSYGLKSERRVKKTAARDIMHLGAECVGEQETLLNAAQRMADQEIGSLLICGKNQHVRGIVTDRDIVVECVAQGRDPQTMTAGELAEDQTLFSVGPAADVSEVLEAMEDHLVRRLPVVGKSGQPVGIISEADLARNLSEEEVGHFEKIILAAL